VGSIPVTETLAGEILSLPMYAELADEQIAYVIDALQEFSHVYKPIEPMDISAMQV
jgi:dTDP-4-amino-4,6-dideoxygalactose transaminase